jgi:hypothetical protein
MTADLHDVRRRLAGLWIAAQNRVAASARRSALLRNAYARGKAAGQVLQGDFGSMRAVVTRPGDELRGLLSRVLVDSSTGRPVPEADRERLRRLAIENQVDDGDGLAIAAMTMLAERFDDAAARAWVPVMLAQAGRFEEAAGLQMTFAPGRPGARGYAILVTALAELGRQDEAADRIRSLQQKFPGLQQEFVHIWSDDPLSVAYRNLVQLSPAQHGVLPVFQHLPFCAGTSMQFSLHQVVPWQRTLQIGRRWGLLQIEQALNLPADKIAGYRLVHQHHPYALSLPGRELTHFTVLRDPVSQIRSGFYKRTAREKIISTRDVGSTTFAEHAEYTMSAGLTNMLTRMIISTHPAMRPIYAREFNSTGAFTMISTEEDMFWLEATRKFSDERLLSMARETLDQNFHVVATMAHLAAGHLACTATVGVPLAHAIVHRGRSGQPPAEAGSVESRLRDANAVDQQLYDEYSARFERDYPDLITAVESPAKKTATVG